MLHDLWRAITAAMNSWHQGKLFVEHLLTISPDMLHLLFGLLVWLAIGMLSRRPLVSWRPWLWLLVLILWNEAVDLWVERWPDAGQRQMICSGLDRSSTSVSSQNIGKPQLPKAATSVDLPAPAGPVNANTLSA